ncbi:hypothetical protein C5S32_11645 [ANME-1 cluster archaeon GoMg1]|nr:hypothetical protein [ANME-1 cluster archaeon GoMg1]
MTQVKILFNVDDEIMIHDDVIENAGGVFGLLNRGSI